MLTASSIFTYPFQKVVFMLLHFLPRVDKVHPRLLTRWDDEYLTQIYMLEHALHLPLQPARAFWKQ